MSDLEDLQKKVIEFRDARNWKQFHNPKDLAISLLLESSELLEQFQWKSENEIREHIKNNPTQIADEIIDVLYWLLLLANDLDIHIEDAFSRKMAINAKKYPVSKSRGSHKKYTDLK